MSSPPSGRGTSTKGVRKEPPQPKRAIISIPPEGPEPDARTRGASAGGTSQPRSADRGPLGRGALLGALAVAIIVVLGILLLTGGSGSRKVPVRSSKRQSIALKPIGGITGMRVEALLTPIGGASVRLTVSATSRYSYFVNLLTPPKKVEPLFSSAEGESHFAHDLTLQHLLGYHYLRVYTVGRSPTRVQVAAQIPTSVLAEGIIAR
jgi:hypothetical protein